MTCAAAVVVEGWGEHEGTARAVEWQVWHTHDNEVCLAKTTAARAFNFMCALRREEAEATCGPGRGRRRRACPPRE